MIENSKLRCASIVSSMAVLILTMSSVGGCAYLKEAIGLGPLRPKVKLVDVEIKHVSMVALSLEISIKIDNPNNFEMKLKNLKYDMVASDIMLADGDYTEQITIPASGNTEVKLPVAVNPSHAISFIKQILNDGKEIISTVSATADFTTPFGDTEVSFEQTKPLRKFTGL
jgi:LEA14-like dessication related protein